MAFVHAAGWDPPSGLIKSTKNGDGLRVGAYGVRFSGPDEKDLAGEYFTPSTQFGKNFGNGAPTMINHGHPFTEAMAEFADIILPPASVQRDAKGLFVSTTLDLSDPLQETISQLVMVGALRWSSGTAAHVMRKAADGQILRWLPIEFSFTPTPCEPRLPAIRRLN